MSVGGGLKASTKFLEEFMRTITTSRMVSPEFLEEYLGL